MSHITHSYIPYVLHSPVGSPRGNNDRMSPPTQGFRPTSAHTSHLSLCVDGMAVKPVTTTNVTGVRASVTSTRMTCSTSLASRPQCVTVSSTQPYISALPDMAGLPCEISPRYPPCSRDQTPVTRLQSYEGHRPTGNGQVKYPCDDMRHQLSDGYRRAGEGQARHSRDYFPVMRQHFDEGYQLIGEGHATNPSDQTPVTMGYEAHSRISHGYEHVIGRQLDGSAEHPCDYQLDTAHRSEVTVDGPLDDRHHIQKRQVYPYRGVQNNLHGVQYPQEHNFPGIYAPEGIPAVVKQPTQREHVYGVRNTDSSARHQDLPVKTKRPTQYDGRSSCRDYLVQFEMISKMNRWDNTTCALELATSLSGQALAMLTDIEPSQRQDYDTLVNALLTRFEPDNQSEVFRSQLKCRVRKQGEGLAELGQDVKRLVRKAYPEASNSLRDILAKDAFSDALNDYELERSIRFSHGTGLDEALRVALEEEAFKKGRQERLGTKAIVRRHVERTGNQVNTQSMCIPDTNTLDAPALTDDIISHITQLVIDQTGKQSANKNHRQPRGKCHNCGKTGHYMSNCKLKHSDAISHMCTMCGSIFQKARGLRDHMYMTHGQRGHSRRSAVEAGRKLQEDQITSSPPRTSRDAPSLRSVISIPTGRNPPGDGTSSARTVIVPPTTSTSEK